MANFIEKNFDALLLFCPIQFFIKKKVKIQDNNCWFNSFNIMRNFKYRVF